MQVHNAEALALTYGVTSTKASNALAALSPLVSEALALLEQPGQNPLYGPIPALQTVSTELTEDKRDLAWRVDWIKTTDAQPLGTTGKVTAYAPTTGGPNGTFDLDAALTATGLTTEEQQQAKEAILGGEDFTDAISAAKQRTHNDNMAMFRRMEAQAWTETEQTPIEEADFALDQIRDILDTAKQDKGDGVGSETGDSIWSTNDLKAMVENNDGYYTDEQVEHARTVLAMAESSGEARDYLGITESGGGWSWGDIGHLTLDVFGMVPIVGNAADGINAAWYAAEGKWLDAALSSIALIPGIGQAATLAKPAIKAAASGIVFKNLDEALQWARRWLDEAGILKRSDNASSSSTMFSQQIERSNVDALANGTNLPFSEATAREIAERAGVGLDGVNIQILETADELRYLDSNGAGAFASDGTIYLGPAVFDDPELLARTIAHERTHIYQQAVGLDLTSSLADLEDAAYLSESTFLDYYRQTS